MFRIVLALVTLTLPVAARDTGQRENQPIYLRQWFQKLMQPDNPDMSCYGEADALEADSFEIRGDQYVAIITNGKGIIPEGTRISVPKNKGNGTTVIRRDTASSSSVTPGRSTAM
jgi:hypothetical protein